MSKARSRRIAVLGSELDGLVAALAAARRGHQVTLIEEGDLLGGVAAAVEIAPGFRAPLALDRGRLRGDVLRWLDLPAEHLAPPELPAIRDAPEAGEWLAQMEDLRHWARRITHRPAPPLGWPRDWRQDWRPALTTGLATRLLGKRRLRRLTRVASLPIADWLGESMDDGPVAAALAAPALESTVGGPMTMGTGLNALLRAGTTGARSAQGLPALAAWLENALAATGVEVRRGVPLQGLHRVEDSWIVHLESGEAVEFDAVVSALPPPRLFLKLLAGRGLPVEMIESLESLRARGYVGIVSLAIDAAPPQVLRQPGTIHQLGWRSLAVLEEAADEAKHRRMADQPPIEFAVSSLDDPSLAPEGAAVVTAQARYCPPGIESQRLIDCVVGALSPAWPNAADRIVATRAWTPTDLERNYRLPGGHLEHAEWALDQLLFLRPDSRCRGGSTPLPGLSICGPGCHPGVGLHGGSAAWSARRR